MHIDLAEFMLESPKQNKNLNNFKTLSLKSEKFNPAVYLPSRAITSNKHENILPHNAVATQCHF